MELHGAAPYRRHRNICAPGAGVVTPVRSAHTTPSMQQHNRHMASSRGRTGIGRYGSVSTASSPSGPSTRRHSAFFRCSPGAAHTAASGSAASVLVAQALPAHPDAAAGAATSPCSIDGQLSSDGTASTQLLAPWKLSAWLLRSDTKARPPRLVQRARAVPLTSGSEEDVDDSASCSSRSTGSSRGSDSWVPAVQGTSSKVRSLVRCGNEAEALQAPNAAHTRA